MFPIHDDQPKYSPSTITTLLILANVLVFLFELSLDEYSRNLLVMQYGIGAGAFPSQRAAHQHVSACGMGRISSATCFSSGHSDEVWRTTWGTPNSCCSICYAGWAAGIAQDFF